MTRSRVALLGEQSFDRRPGGMNRYAGELHQALLDAGVDAHRFLLGGSEPTGEATHWAGSVTANGVDRMVAMRRSVTEHGPFDLVDVHFAPYAGLVRHSPLVVHFQGPWAAESRAEGARRTTVLIRRLLETSVYRRADAAVVLSDAFADILSGYGIPDDRISVIPPGVDLDSFQPRRRQETRAALGIEADAFVVVCTRRLVERMGHRVLFDALDLLGPMPALHVAIIGEGPLRPQIEERAATAGVSVSLPGRVSDDRLVDWYSAADLQVVPSVELEGYGLVVPEGLACGVPALVSDLGGMAELMRSIAPDLVVPAGDPAALAERLKAALEGPLPSVDVCRGAVEGLSWARVVDRHLDLYRSLGVEL